jgi:hypothetical protein
MPRTLILLAILTAAACTHGPRLESLSFPTRPEGAQTAVRTATTAYAGELLTASDTGFVVLMGTSQRVVFIPASTARRVRVEALGEFPLPLGASALRKVRLVSRHPYGMPAEARAAVLALTGQSDFERVDQ